MVEQVVSEHIPAAGGLVMEASGAAVRHAAPRPVIALWNRLSLASFTRCLDIGSTGRGGKGHTRRQFLFLIPSIPAKLGRCQNMP